MKLFNIEPPIYLYHIADNTDTQVELATHVLAALHTCVKNYASITVSHSNIVSSEVNRMVNLCIRGEVDSMVLDNYSLLVDPNDTISSVTDQILQVLAERHALFGHVAFRLRRSVNNTPDNPLYLDRTVKESGLDDGNIVCIEKGQPALSSQMVLYYSLPSDATNVHSIVCKPAQTISHCLEKMVEHSELTGSSYYLMTVDWAGEPSDVVYNVNNSLAKARIRHGDHVVLKEGVPPPKDAVTVNIKWAQESCQSAEDSYIQWLVNSIEDMSLEDVSVKPNRPTYSCWSTQVDRNTTIEDLKRQLVPVICEQRPVGETGFIRLRSIRSHGPGLIYKNPQKTLRQYKLNSLSVNMLAEVLPEVDSLR